MVMAGAVRSVDTRRKPASRRGFGVPVRDARLYSTVDLYSTISTWGRVVPGPYGCKVTYCMYDSSVEPLMACLWVPAYLSLPSRPVY